MWRQVRRTPWTRRAEKAQASFFALDVGTEWAKAVVVSGGEGRVLGVGRARQQLSSMDGGAVAHIEGVAAAAGRALQEAATLAGSTPRRCLVGIAGELVQGVVTTVKHERRRPERPLAPAEITRLAAAARPRAVAEAEIRVSRYTGFESPHLELVDAALVDVAVDGYRVANPVDFRGRHLEIAVFHTFSPLVHVRALETVAERLGAEVMGMVAKPYAVAACALPPEAYEIGAVVVDIGGGSTDVAVIERRGLIGTKMIAMGGRAFTRSLAEALGEDLGTAEEIKLDYAAGTLEGELVGQVREVVRADLQVLGDALRFALADLKGAEALPARVYLCGGGSALPGVSELLRDAAWVREGYFARPPAVFTLDAAAVVGVRDDFGFLQGARDVTPKALAAQGVLAWPVQGMSWLWTVPENATTKES